MDIIKSDKNESKSHFAATLISNCGNDRWSYINELKKIMPIDIYGGCGMKCPENCRQYIAGKYKFFFVYENSVCRGYVTEK